MGSNHRLRLHVRPPSSLPSRSHTPVTAPKQHYRNVHRHHLRLPPFPQNKTTALLPQHPQVRTPPFHTDDLQFSGQSQGQQNRFVDPFGQSSSQSGSDKAGISVLLQSVGSYAHSSERDGERGRHERETGELELPGKAFLGRETAHNVS